MCDYHRDYVRTMGVFSGVMTLGFGLISVSILTKSISMMYFGMVLLGVVSGILYGLGLLMVSEWMQRSPASTALAMLCYMMGTVGGTVVLASLLEWLDFVVVFFCAGIVLCAVTLFSAIWFAFPDGIDIEEEEAEFLEAEEDPLAPQNLKLGLAIFLEKDLYLLLFIIGITLGPSGAIVNAFSGLLKDLVGMEASVSAFLYTMLTTMGLVARLCTGQLAQSLNYKGFFSFGSKNLTIVSCALELVSMIVLRIGVRSKVILISGLVIHWIPMSFMQVCVVLLAQDFFGPANCGVVFGLSSFVGGVSALVFTYAMAFIEDAPHSMMAHYFESFCVVCGGLSLVGLGFSLWINRVDKCFATSFEIECLLSEKVRQQTVDKIDDLGHSEAVSMRSVAPAHSQIFTEIGQRVEPFARSFSFAERSYSRQGDGVFTSALNAYSPSPYFVPWSPTTTATNTAVSVR